MLTGARRRALSESGDDSGMTLAELLVGMGLLLVVATLTTTFFVAQSQQTGRTIDASFSTANGRTTLTTIATELRLADTPTAEPGYPTGRFVTATATHVVFFSNITANRGGDADRTPPTKIDIHVSGTQLIEQDYRPLHIYTTYPRGYDTSNSSNYPSTPSSTTYLVAALTNTTAVFSYCAPPTATTACPAINPADLGTVASVGITLQLPDRAGKNPQFFQTTIAVTGAFS